MTRRIPLLICTGSAALLLLVLPGATANAQTQMQIYGAWHCYTDACSWASVPNMTTFDTDNRWLIDRNMNSTYQPSVNLVVLSFVDPVKLMNLTTDSGDSMGIPIGMNTAVINYFQSRGVRVMMSIGGPVSGRIGTRRCPAIRRNWAATRPMPPSSSMSAWKSIMKTAAVRTLRGCSSS